MRDGSQHLLEDISGLFFSKSSLFNELIEKLQTTQVFLDEEDRVSILILLNELHNVRVVYLLESLELA